jgi:hypothetical protein
LVELLVGERTTPPSRVSSEGGAGCILIKNCKNKNKNKI